MFEELKEKDPKQYKKIIIHLYEQGDISIETTLEEIGFDPKQEIKRKKLEIKDLEQAELHKSITKHEGVTITIDNLHGGVVPSYDVDPNNLPLVMAPDHNIQELINDKNLPYTNIFVPQYPVNETSIHALFEIMNEALEKGYKDWMISVRAPMKYDEKKDVTTHERSFDFGFVAWPENKENKEKELGI